MLHLGYTHASNFKTRKARDMISSPLTFTLTCAKSHDMRLEKKEKNENDDRKDIFQDFSELNVVGYIVHDYYFINIQDEMIKSKLYLYIKWMFYVELVNLHGTSNYVLYWIHGEGSPVLIPLAITGYKC